MAVLEFVDRYDIAVGSRSYQCVIDSDWKVGFRGHQGSPRLSTYRYTKAGVFTPADDASGIGGSCYDLTLSIIGATRIVITSGGSGDVAMQSYDSDGLLSLIDTLTTTFPKTIVLDDNRGIAFIGEGHAGGPTIESYPFTIAGFGSLINATSVDSRMASWLGIDSEDSVLFLKSDNNPEGLTSWSYDNDGDNITYKDVANTYNIISNGGGAFVHTEKKWVIDASDSGIYIYPYNSDGTFEAALSSITARAFCNLVVDTASRTIYATASGTSYRVYVYSYSEDGTVITELGAFNEVNYYHDCGCALDSINGILMVPVRNFTTGDEGFISFLAPLSMTCHGITDDLAKATVRKMHSKLEITWSDSFIDNTLSASVNDSNVVNDAYSLISQVIDQVTAVPRQWAHLDGALYPDGTFYPMPGNILSAAENQVGWWGTEECDSSGEWVVDPTLITQFAARPLYSLIVCGENIYGEYPRSFEINVYTLAADVVPVHTETVTDDVGTGWALSKVDAGDAQAVKWDKTLTVDINSCEKIELIVKKWNVAGRVVKISEFYTAIVNEYDGDDIVSLRFLEESEIADGTLPVGNISCNEVDIKLQNVDNQFFWNNTASPIHTQLKVNRKIVAYLGIEKADTSIHWETLGTFFSGDWDAEENGTTASTTARDRMELLRKADYEVSELQEDITLYDLAELVLNDAKTKITDLQWNIDIDLQNFIIPYAWFPKQSYFKCIKSIVGACMGRAYMNRNDVLQIETDL